MALEVGAWALGVPWPLVLGPWKLSSRARDEVQIHPLHRRRARRHRSGGARLEALRHAAVERLRRRSTLAGSGSEDVAPGSARRDPGGAAVGRPARARDDREAARR